MSSLGFSFASYILEWVLEKMITWKHQWGQTKKYKNLNKILFSLAKGLRKGQLS